MREILSAAVLKQRLQKGFMIKRRRKSMYDSTKKNMFKNSNESLDQLIVKIDDSLMPRHIAIIMDGNGRWAKKRLLPRQAGHKQGMDTLHDIVEFSKDLGIETLTVFAFSTENWKRPQEEVSFLMNLFIEYLFKETRALHRKNVKINFIGDMSSLNAKIQEEASKASKLTEHNRSMTLNLAVNYGSRQEITRAMRKLAEEVAAGRLDPSQINEAMIESNLYTADMPDPDLLIRTSGESRISNFLLWQLAYTEIFCTPVFWPDFGRKDLVEAIIAYQKRDRRFGGIVK